MAIAAGDRIGPYEVLSPLGAGGMGEVWRARDARLGREVAIKFLPADFAKDTDRLLRFEQEARAISALNHPNIVTIYDIGSHDRAPFIIAELLEELRAALERGAVARASAGKRGDRDGEEIGRWKTAGQTARVRIRANLQRHCKGVV
jgi:eukaryotic-like serine/threonine-protein kinase